MKTLNFKEDFIMDGIPNADHGHILLEQGQAGRPETSPEAERNMGNLNLPATGQAYAGSDAVQPGYR